ncbi:MAG: ribonuclease HIII [Bacilli bacterium]|nr:ribonuclease HIII [Bacilli bacterium]
MTIVFKVSENIKKKMMAYYEDKKREKTPPYAIFQADEADTIITLYESGKAMFQGVSADIDANLWIEMEKKLNNRIIDIDEKKKEKEKYKENLEYFYSISTIGSDEVGTGDYFGPIVVTATFVSKDKIDLMNDLGVKDSKKITDDKIIKIAPTLIKEIPYVTFILNNKEYNAYQKKGYNMNKIKAILHNKVLYALTHKEEKYPYDKIVVDQFVYPRKYFEHIIDAKDKVMNITFTTKAESKCASVAAASIISRYIFLKQMDDLGKDVGLDLPKGANDSVDSVGKDIVLKYGLEKLDTIAKLNFKNTDKIKKMLK